MEFDGFGCGDRLDRLPDSAASLRGGESFRHSFRRGHAAANFSLPLRPNQRANVAGIFGLQFSEREMARWRAHTRLWILHASDQIRASQSRHRILLFFIRTRENRKPSDCPPSCSSTTPREDAKPTRLRPSSSTKKSARWKSGIPSRACSEHQAASCPDSGRVVEYRRASRLKRFENANVFRPRDSNRGPTPKTAWVLNHKPTYSTMPNQCIHKLSVNLAGSPERGCVRSSSRSRFGVTASLRCCCDWLSAQPRSTDNAWMHRCPIAVTQTD